MINKQHLIVDCSDVPFDICINDKLIFDALISVAKTNNLNVITSARYKFGFDSPTGCTVFLMLDESHISVHTYAKERQIALDIFTCGKDNNPKKIFEELKEMLNINNYIIKGEIVRF